LQRGPPRTATTGTQTITPNDFLWVVSFPRTSLFHSDAETRAFTLADLPLIHRLKSHGISLDSESYLARGLHTAEDAALSRLPLAEMGAPTVVARCGSLAAIGQLRHTRGETHAHIVFMAPALTDGDPDTLETVWLRLLDALAVEAGARGAQTIHAEVDENSPIFEVLRPAGYASYARQDIWRRNPAPPPVAGALPLRPAAGRDMPAVRFLHAQTVPRLAQQADPIPAEEGLVYFQEDKAWCYLTVSAGDRGVYLRPYLHPEAEPLAQEVLAGALIALERSARVPVYCCVRQHQGWLNGPLERLGFVPWARQSVLVRHTTSRVEHPAFAPLPGVRGGIPLSSGRSGKG